MSYLFRPSGAWLLVVFYAGGIFVASSLSHPPIITTWNVSYLDKLYHVIAYAGLTFVLSRALRLTCVTRPSTALAVWAAAMAIAYGALDEFHQAFTPKRMMSMYDLLADATGAGIGAGVWRWAQRRWLIWVKA